MEEKVIIIKNSVNIFPLFSLQKLFALCVSHRHHYQHHNHYYCCCCCCSSSIIIIIVITYLFYVLYIGGRDLCVCGGENDKKKSHKLLCARIRYIYRIIIIIIIVFGAF